MRRVAGCTGIRVMLTVGLFGFVVVTARSETVAVADLASANVALLLVGIVLSAIAILNRGLQQQAAHRSMGMMVGAGAITRTTTSGYAANKLVRAGGAPGLAIFIMDGRRRGFSPAHVTAACLVASVGSFGALGILLVVTLFLLAERGELTSWWISAGVAYGIYAVVAAAVVRALFRNPHLIDRLVSTVDRTRHRVAVFLRRERNAEEVRRERPDGSGLGPEVRCALSAWRSAPQSLALTLLHASLSKVAGAAMLFVALRAVGIDADFAAVVPLYATALVASSVSIVPGAVGTVEVSTVAVLLSSGVDMPAAVTAVALFRILDLWLPVAAGVVVGGGRRPEAVRSPLIESPALAISAEREPLAA